MYIANPHCHIAGLLLCLKLNQVLHVTGLVCVCARAVRVCVFNTIFTTRKQSLGQGNIFTPVCHSVHRGEVLDQVSPRTRYTPLDQVHPPGTRYTPGTRYPPGTRYTPWDQVHPPGTRYTPLGPGTLWEKVHPPGKRYTLLGPGTPPQTRYTPPGPGTPLSLD